MFTNVSKMIATQPVVQEPLPTCADDGTDHAPCMASGAATQPERQSDLNLAVIGNCSFSSMIDKMGRHCFTCFPSLDSAPLFCSLLKGPPLDFGFWDVVVENFQRRCNVQL